ncbi:MAG: hypothetical protein J6K04_01545 [Lachnospiraceae bacterium]|nr:hypothetical protein [Lachnospiraceae bacterium]
MLLYSTKFTVKESFAKKEFVSLVLQWNQNSPHDKMRGISWNEQDYNLHFKDGKRTLAINELVNYHLIAARFRKEDEHGVVWTTDYILNYEERKLAVRLDRETTEDTTKFVPKFSRPHFVRMVISNGYAGKDAELEISNEAISITKSNYKIIEDIIMGNVRYDLPIIYVTKTWAGNYPVKMYELTDNLQGVAHVLKETDASVSKLLMKNCEGKNAHHGGIGIYYPSSSAASKTLDGSKYITSEEILVRKITDIVFRYMNQQIREEMYTWEGVQYALVRARNEELAKMRDNVENENKEILDFFEEQLQNLEGTIKELNNKNAALAQELQGLRRKVDMTENIPILIYGEEDDLYEGEIREIVMDILVESKKKNQKENSRRAHVIKDIIETNRYDEITKSREKRIKQVLKGYRSMSSSMRQDLQEFGFTITEDGKHYKLTFCDDPRYVATMAKTSSDHQSGDNLSATIIKNML